MGLSRPAAGLAAVLSLLVSSPYGPGLQGLFHVGLVPKPDRRRPVCLALGAIVRTLDGPGASAARRPGTARWRRPGRAGPWPARAAAAVAALLVTHLISVLILVVFVALTVAARAAIGRLSGRGLRRLTLAAVGTVGLAAFWLVPFLAHRDLHGVYTGWDTPAFPTRLADIATGRILFPAGLAALVAAGWLHQLGRAARRGLGASSDGGPVVGRQGPDDPARAAVVWSLVPALYLPVAYGALRLLGPGDVTLQLPNRGLGYVGLMAVFAVAAPAAALAARFGRRGQAAALVLAGAAVLAFAPGRGTPGQLAEPHPELRRRPARSGNSSRPGPALPPSGTSPTRSTAPA